VDCGLWAVDCGRQGPLTDACAGRTGEGRSRADGSGGSSAGQVMFLVPQ
jgi:hypothetical protein